MARYSGEYEPKDYPRKQPDEDYLNYFKRYSKWQDGLFDISEALPRNQLKGRLIRFRRADGYASYIVRQEKPLVVAHIPGSYYVEVATMRGLNLADVRQEADYEDRMHKHLLEARKKQQERMAKIPDSGVCEGCKMGDPGAASTHLASHRLRLP